MLKNTDSSDSYICLQYEFIRGIFLDILDQNIPAFNLTSIVDNRIQPGIYFKHLINAMLSNAKTP